MQNFFDNAYTININKLEKTVKDVIQAGYNVTVIINGEYYNISTDEEKKPGKTAKRRYNTHKEPGKARKQ